MAWINVRPANSGGGRQPGEPTAKLYDNGQLTLSHAAVALLGHPPRVRMQVEPDAKRIRQPLAAGHSTRYGKLSAGDIEQNCYTNS